MEWSERGLGRLPSRRAFQASLKVVGFTLSETEKRNKVLSIGSTSLACAVKGFF